MPLRNRNRNTIPNFRKVGGFTGLLDEYGGAAAAYSVRRLSSTYEGAIIEIRVDTAGQPVYDIGFDSNGDLDTADLLSKAGGNDAFVRTWYDQSGNGSDATQTTISNQPQIVNSGVLLKINTKPSLSFDGIKMFLLNNSLAASSTQSVFYVKKGLNLASNSSLFGFPTTVSNTQIGIYYFNSPPYYYGFNTWAADCWGYSNANSEFLSQTLEMALFKNNNPSTSGVKLFINNNNKTLSQVLGTSVNRIMNNGFRIGIGGTATNNENFDGYMQEIIIWSNDYSIINRTNIKNKINSYFSIY